MESPRLKLLIINAEYLYRYDSAISFRKMKLIEFFMFAPLRAFITIAISRFVCHVNFSLFIVDLRTYIIAFICVYVNIV